MIHIKINGYWKDDKAEFEGKIVRIVPVGTEIDTEEDNENDNLFFTAETAETEEDKIIIAFINEYGKSSREDWVTTEVTHVLIGELDEVEDEVED
jgi:hypothetical protein